MQRFTVIAFALFAVSCGRTDLDEMKPDASTPLPPMMVTPRGDALFVFTGSPCPRNGTESELTVSTAGDRLVLVKSQAQQECSGAGGEWLVGREVGAPRDYFVGAHACTFLPSALSDNRDIFWGVARVSQTAALFRAPKDWCINRIETFDEEATSDSIVRVWALYWTEADARAAFAEFSN